MTGIEKLWSNQRQLMQHVVSGIMSDREIAEEVGCSEHIVKITRESRIARELQKEIPDYVQHGSPTV